MNNSPSHEITKSFTGLNVVTQYSPIRTTFSVARIGEM